MSQVSKSHRRGRLPVAVLMAAIGCALVVAVFAGKVVIDWGTRSRVSTSVSPDHLEFQGADAAETDRSHAIPPQLAAHRDMAQVRREVVHFCGACHAVPRPDYFPREAWESEVKQGFNFYRTSFRSDLKVPAIGDVVQYYTSLAPEKVELPMYPAATGGNELRFSKVPNATTASFGDVAVAGVSHLNFVNFGTDQGAALLATEMGTGAVWSETLRGKGLPELRTTLAHPAHAEMCDLDRDGLLDVVVADLGSFAPEDHDRGRVVWLRQVADAPYWSIIPIQERLARVSDVRPADFDADGDLDLLVAEFGWRMTGRILLLENRGFDGSAPHFVMHVLDERHGTIHLPVLDLNGDGRLDFVALISQEHEVIVAFLNRGDLTFQRETISAQHDPAYGSSGIQFVDLDKDGDTDILYSNGDTFDSHQLKPYHGIQWLENAGGYPYVPHHLTTMPGVHRALAGDMDQDGDFDIVAVAALSPRMLSTLEAEKLDSVIWLEQVRPGEFLRHSLERGDCTHAALELADFDADGDLDLAVGNFRMNNRKPSYVLWLNQLQGESALKSDVTE